MKSLLFTLAIAMLVSSYTNRSIPESNTYNIPEMEKLCSYTQVDFESFVMNKGYSYNSITSSDYSKVYECEIKRENGVADHVIRTQNPSESIQIGFYTTEKQFYIDFKASLLKSGYKFLRQEEEPASPDITTTWYYYSNKKYLIAIYNFTSWGHHRYCHVIEKIN